MGELLEELVADRVAVLVVDALEAVEVDEEQAARADLADEGVVDALGQERAVGQAGERVVLGAVQELGLEGLAGVDVLDVRDEVRRPVPALPARPPC